MKKQIVIIHGGGTFNSYKDYISFLKNSPVDIKRFMPRRGWKDNIDLKLGSKFEVFTPQMPNKTNAKYKEWKIVFEKLVPFLNDEVVLVGHSLGGIFLAKYLAENSLNKKIKALILLSAPFRTEKSWNESLGDFELPVSLKKIELQVKNIFLIHSRDDKVVPFNHLNKYHRQLPSSKLFIFNDRNHFNQETFPELIKLIKTI
jgi:uncharacterized protein